MRKIFITGGTGTIGARLVEEMVKDGHFVYFSSRSSESGEGLMDKLGLNSNQAKAVILNFDEPLDKLKLQEIFGQWPDVIIHNARSLETLRVDKNGRITSEQFQKEFNNGVTYPYALTNMLLDNGIPLKDVIFISSIYGNVAPNPALYEDFKMQSPVNYGVVKAAQIHLTKELAVRMAPNGIRVNVVSFGGVKGRVNEAFKKRYAKLTPLGRMLSHADLYPPIQYLLNNPALNVTGENLKVDGGWTIW